MALGLLSGYGWLGVGGLLWILFAGAAGGRFYDAKLHTVFLGFISTMVFAHVPIILPAVLAATMPYRPGLYVPLLTLDLSLLLRVTGDLAGWLPGRRWGGLLNVLVLLVFLANTLDTIRDAPRGDEAARSVRFDRFSGVWCTLLPSSYRPSSIHIMRAETGARSV